MTVKDALIKLPMWAQTLMRVVPFFLCVPSCPLWFWHLHFINHQGHEGTQKRQVENSYLIRLSLLGNETNSGASARGVSEDKKTPAPAQVELNTGGPFSHPRFNAHARFQWQ
jgi:hypothetical protein